MSVCCECCVLSGRGLCDRLITRPEESCRLWCVVVLSTETSWMRRPWPTGGFAPKTNKQANKQILWIKSHCFGTVGYDKTSNIRVRKFCAWEVFRTDIHLPSHHHSPDTDSVLNEIKEM
jgi:hypothetical protein